ncbi:hypothetical protein FKM82_011419 [Ascaphus truei]
MSVDFCSYLVQTSEQRGLRWICGLSELSPGVCSPALVSCPMERGAGVGGDNKTSEIGFSHTVISSPVMPASAYAIPRYGRYQSHL